MNFCTNNIFILIHILFVSMKSLKKRYHYIINLFEDKIGPFSRKQNTFHPFDSHLRYLQYILELILLLTIFFISK